MAPVTTAALIRMFVLADPCLMVASLPASSTAQQGHWSRTTPGTKVLAIGCFGPWLAVARRSPAAGFSGDTYG